MKIINKKIEEIREYWRNPRFNEKTVEALVKSIERYGFNNPLSVDKDNVLVTGHARFRALKKMGYKTAPCIVIDAPDQIIKEYRIRDNQIHDLTEWDDQSLIKEIQKIASFDQAIQFFDGTIDETFKGILDIGTVSLETGNIELTNTGVSNEVEQQGNPEYFEKMGREDTEHGEVVIKVPCPYCSHLNTIS